MRKTPGKWIKNLLLGKKSSKSNPSKKRDIFKPSSNKDVLVSSEASFSDPIVESSLVSQPRADATTRVISEKEVVSRSSNDQVILSAGNEEANAQAVTNSGSQVDPEKIRLTEAAIKAQAAFRGYQARQAFQTLKGIMQLQALIRGHLVRRQAISTLYCVKGIIKFQALARGYKVRHSDIGLAVHKILKDSKCSYSSGGITSTQADKLSHSVFVNKLLASSSSPVPLYLNHDLGEPNLTWNWLDRWTRSQFWEPLPESKKKPDCVSDEKNGNCRTDQNRGGQVKRNASKASGLKVDDGSISDSNKYKRLPKKVSSHPHLLHSAQEHPQKEIDKSNLKKTPVRSVSDKSEVVDGKRKHITRKVSGHAVTDVAEQGPGASAEKIKDLAVSKSKEPDLEKSPGQQAEDDHDNKLHDNPIADLQASMSNGRDEGGVREDLNCGDNFVSNVNPKNCQRRASLPANFDDQDNSVQNTPRLPSYMAPTESAKAKLRGQGSPRFASDLLDKNGITRRHSLSSSYNGKLGSFSPRAERLVAMNSRGVIKTDRSLSSSRDGSDRLIQPQWRR